MKSQVEQPESDQQGGAQSVNDETMTVVVSRRVRKGQEAAFEEASTRMTETAAAFPGYLGASLFRPANPNDPEYRIVFKFDSREHLEQWQTSAVRQRLLEDFEPLLEEPSRVEVMSGIVPWFSFPGQNPVQPPPKYKMTLVSWLALYPTVTLIFWLFGAPLEALPLPLRTLLVTAAVMVIMSYVLMPRFTRWFAPWLFANRSRER